MPSTAQSPFNGTERFHLRRRVGQGAVGVVYEAWDDELKARVALKALRGVSPDGIVSLKKDFRAVQDIRHANLVHTGELFEESGTWFFTMEFVDGVPLNKYVRPGEGSAPFIGSGSDPAVGVPVAPRYDEARLRAALPQLVHALRALHAHEKVHRDVKPSNILVTDAGRLVLLDFGVVSDLARGESDHDLVGTVAYMAPEQALAEAIGPAADWYAVGAVLYEALTGRLPFYGLLHDVMARKLQRAPPPPSTLVSDLPRDLEELCLDLLRMDPRDRPKGREILTRLGLAAREGPGTLESYAQVFVGRDEELSALRRAFDDVRDGATVSALVHGESGVGKSFLVRRFLWDVQDVQEGDEGALVLAGRCFERESVPYKAVDGIVDQLRQRLAALDEPERNALLPTDAPFLVRAFPVLEDVVPKREAHVETGNPQAIRARMFLAFRELLARVGARRPLILSIDDLQWADKDSLDLLTEVMRPPDTPCLLLLATLRVATDQGWSSDDRMKALEIAGDVRHIHVQHLAQEEAGVLIKALTAGSIDASTIDEMVADSKGHPLFIDELVRQRASQRRAKVVRLDDALWARVTGLEPPVQRLLELITVAGLPLSQGLAADAAAIELGELSELAAELRVGHLAKTSGARREDVIEVYHDRVRQSVLAHLEPAARSRWHGRLATALERAQSDDAETLAVHWHGAGDPERAATYAERAADAAVRTLAFERAARLYRFALDLASHEDDAARSLRRRLAEALLNAGYVANAAEVNLVLATGATGEQALDLRRRAAEQLLCSGRFDEGLAILRQVLGAAGVYFPRSPLMVILSVLYARFVLAVRGLEARASGSTPSAAALARADATWAAGAGFAMTDNVRGAYFQSRNLAICLDLGDRERVARALAMEVCFRSATGRKAEAKTAKLLAKEWVLAREVGTPEVVGMAHAATGYHHFMVGRWRLAVEAFTEAEATFRDHCIGVTFNLNSVRAMMYRALAWRGRYRDLEARVTPVVREVEQRADQYGIANVRSGPMVLLGLRDDEPQRVREELAEANARLPQGAFLVQHYYTLLAECQVDQYGADGAAALGRIQAAWPAIRRSLLLRVQTVRVNVVEQRLRAALAAAASHVSARSELLSIAERDVRRLEGEGLPWTSAVATMFRGGLSAARGDAGAASKWLEDAERQCDAADMQMHAAACRLRRGQIMGGTAGESLVRGATARFEAEGTRKPERMARLYLPERGRT